MRDKKHRHSHYRRLPEGRLSHHLRKLSFSLSERERKLLNFVAKGRSNKEIAGSMRLSPSTVKRHGENILRKLHLKNGVEAAVYAITKATWASEGLMD